MAAPARPRRPARPRARGGSGGASDLLCGASSGGGRAWRGGARRFGVGAGAGAAREEAGRGGGGGGGRRRERSAARPRLSARAGADPALRPCRCRRRQGRRRLAEAAGKCAPLIIAPAGLRPGWEISRGAGGGGGGRAGGAGAWGLVCNGRPRGHRGRGPRRGRGHRAAPPAPGARPLPLLGTGAPGGGLNWKARSQSPERARGDVTAARPIAAGEAARASAAPAALGAGTRGALPAARRPAQGTALKGLYWCGPSGHSRPGSGSQASRSSGGGEGEGGEVPGLVVRPGSGRAEVSPAGPAGESAGLAGELWRGAPGVEVLAVPAPWIPHYKLGMDGHNGRAAC